MPAPHVGGRRKLCQCGPGDGSLRLLWCGSVGQKQGGPGRGRSNDEGTANAKDMTEGQPDALPGGGGQVDLAENHAQSGGFCC